MAEKKLQTEIASWLRMNGVYVIVTRVLPGTPVGCEDIIGLYKDRWIAIEVKKSADAPFRPGQKQTIAMHREHNPFVYVAYPENWWMVKAEITKNFF